MQLTLLDETYSVCKLTVGSEIPGWAFIGSFISVTRTKDELSIVCEQRHVPSDVKSEPNWRVFKVQGPLDFGLTGILASIANPLADAKVSIFAISTFDTDYVMIKANDLKTAKACLISAGFSLT